MTVTIAAIDKNDPQSLWRIRHGKIAAHNHPPASSAAVFLTSRQQQLINNRAPSTVAVDCLAGTEPRRTVARLHNEGNDLVQPSDIDDEKRRIQNTLTVIETPTECVGANSGS